MEYSQKKFINYFISFPSLSKAINLDSFTDLDMHVYLEDFQEAIAPILVKINPFMNFKFLLLNIQLTLLYLLSIARYISHIIQSIF